MVQGKGPGTLPAGPLCPSSLGGSTGPGLRGSRVGLVQPWVGCVGWRVGSVQDRHQSANGPGRKEKSWANPAGREMGIGLGNRSEAPAQRGEGETTANWGRADAGATPPAWGWLGPAGGAGDGAAPAVAGTTGLACPSLDPMCLRIWVSSR